VLITLISLLPGVSGAGHLGGAVAGALAAVLLHYQRFGGRVLRGAAAAGLLALPVGCVLGLKEFSARDPLWGATPSTARQDQRRQDPVAELHRLDGLENAFRKLRREGLAAVLDAPVKERKPEDVQRALAELPGLARRFRDAASRLEDLGKLKEESLEQERQAGLDYFRKKAELADKIRQSLERRTDWDDNDPLAVEEKKAREKWLQARGGN
jgi:hypothetical protein